MPQGGPGSDRRAAPTAATAKTRQDLITQVRLRFDIKTVAVDAYSDVTDLIRTVANRCRQRTVFISGSAADYAPWGQEATENLLVRLAAALIDRDCRIAGSLHDLAFRILTPVPSPSRISTPAASNASTILRAVAGRMFPPFSRLTIEFGLVPAACTRSTIAQPNNARPARQASGVRSREASRLSMNLTVVEI